MFRNVGVSLMLVVAGVVGIPVQALLAQTPSADAIAARIQAHYATVRDFTADFSLRQTSSLSPKPKIEKGTVAVKKPLRMRWIYTTSDKNQFIADGSRLYAVYPEDKFFEVSRLPSADESSTWLLFFAGRGDLTRDFNATLAAEQPAGEWRVVFTPKPGRTTDVKTLTLEVDRNTWQMRGLIAVDEQGGTSAYRFTNLRENPGLADRLFEYVPPKSFEVRYR